jgi:DNA repair exonuclease SbcCD ATPase subunit
MATVKLRKKIPSAGYSGSLLQQGYGESLDKGYLLWHIDGQEVSNERRLIPNDYGWCKMTISRGENIEERLSHLQFSHNKRKTKVHIVYEDFEESYSIERLNQIKQLVKDKHGCESIHVEFRELDKQTLNPEEVDQDEIDPNDIERMFNMFLDENDFDVDEDERREIIEFALKLEREIDIKQTHKENRRYTLLTTEVSNVFSFPVEPTTINWDHMRGLTGIFGENYCGKSNLIKAVVWGMFQYIIGGAHAKYLINIYTKSDKGYVRNTYDIDGIRYRSTREVHKGKSSNSYPTKFEVFREAMGPDGAMEYRWCNTMSDNSTADNTEVKNMIADALGTYDDFMKVSLHAQNEKDGYLNLEQQEKNDLIARYLNLHTYRDRHEYVKKPYNELRTKQKLLGESVDIELDIKSLKLQIEDKEKMVSTLEEERRMWTQKQEDAQSKVLELTRSLHKVEDLGYDSKDAIIADHATKLTSQTTLKSAIDLHDEWLDKNVLRELEVDPKRTTEILEAELAEVRSVFATDKQKYLTNKKWLEDNPKKELPNIDVTATQARIDELNRNLRDYQNKRQTFLGKDCPTCKQAISKPDPKGVSDMDALITEGNNAITRYRQSIESFNTVKEWNRSFDTKQVQLDALKVSLESRSKIIESIKLEMENFKKNKEFIELNRIIERKRQEVKMWKISHELGQRELVKLDEKIAKYDSVVQAKANNKLLEAEIETLQALIKTYKLSMHGQQTQLMSLAADVRLLGNAMDDKVKKLNEVKTGDKMYKLYSIYLQAVERSGIPAMVIKKRLPMLNNKINSILQTIVGFKMEFSIDMKGNITELFYNTESKWDALPLNSGSGSQQFIASIAIKDALNYVSKRSIVQPSIMMIDEGFGTLGNELRENIMTMLEYLKGKYQNVVIITHLDEVKEGADHVIEAIRDRNIIMDSAHDRDERAGVTRLHVRR